MSLLVAVSALGSTPARALAPREKGGAAPLARPPPPAQILLLLAQALRVNGLEQLCSNLASERLQLFSSQKLLAQEEVGSWAQT